MNEATRCGYVAILGAPNAGKSTLVNRLVGAKVSIVSPKVQTTRTRVLGIEIRAQCQLIYVDTPGVFAPKRRLERAMVAAAWTGAADADIVVLLVDAQRGVTEEVSILVEQLKTVGRPCLVALNKIDAVRHETLLGQAARLQDSGAFERIFMISALTGDGVEALEAELIGRLPEGPFLFPADQLSDMPQRLLAAELTREQLFLQTHAELPYAVTVETESWTDQPDGSARIQQVIFVERPGQKAIVLGRGGARIKSLGARSRLELERLFDRRIHLFLFVKVRENWQDDPERYGAMGLDWMK